MAIEQVAAAAANANGPMATGARQIDLSPPGSSHSSATPQAEASFKASMQRADGVGSAGHVGAVSASSASTPIKGVFNALDQVNMQAKSVSEYASTAEASGGQLTPGEIVQLTMKCQEFMFQCQLTSNIANRSSDGVQQLFKQQ
jgi:hypothetical protein